MKRFYAWSGIIFLVVFFLISNGKLALSAEGKGTPPPSPGLIPSSFKTFAFGNVKLSWGADTRWRYEYKQDFDFDDEINDKDGYWYGRTRFNLGANINDKVFVFLEGLDARELDSDISPKAYKDDFDLHQAYLKLSKPWDVPVSLTVGRQEFNYGAKRLVATSLWTNTVRSYDAVKFTYNPAVFDVDLFLANRVLYEDKHFNDAYWGENFFGLYTTYKGLPGNIFDLYCLNLIDKSHLVKSEDGTYGPSERYTTGTRGEGKIPCTALGYGYEFAYQFGWKSTDDIKAYAYHLDLNYTFTKLVTQPAVRIEYNFATGDKNPTDNESNTFIPLFQTTHEPYGIIDFFRWQNVKEIAVFLDFVPLKDRVKGSLQYHRFYLDESEDAWYNAAGKKIRQAKKGQDFSTYVGDEVDLVLKYKLFSFLDLEGGYAHFFCGDYVKDTGSSDDADWFYLQTSITF